jgi:hypothetical protein
MKIELDLDNTYNHPTDDNLLNGPVHLIELSKTNVEHLLTIANEVETFTHFFSTNIYFFFNSLILSIKQIE